MKRKERKKLIEKWIGHRFLNSDWKWESENHKQRAKERLFEKIENAIRIPKEVYPNWVKPLAIAASIIIVCSIGFYVNNKLTYTTIQSDSSITRVVSPGTESAILTLEDGTAISLDDAENGIIAKRAYATIKKQNNGQLIYEAEGKPIEDKVFMNRITVPLGGLYEVVLPDGTKVWLNSASILSYPSRFRGKERRVELTGEAFFEVAKNVKMPFKLIASDTEIEVTGTQFNVSAYDGDNRVETTLIEGGVKVFKNNSEIKLVPGQQSISIPGSDYFVRKEVDTEVALAWKRGYFIFDDQDIETVMRKVARWYNVEVTFKKKSGKKKMLGGIFSRTKSIEELLEFLEKLNVGKFEKKGRSVTVMI